LVRSGKHVPWSIDLPSKENKLVLRHGAGGDLSFRMTEKAKSEGLLKAGTMYNVSPQKRDGTGLRTENDEAMKKTGSGKKNVVYRGGCMGK